MEAHSTRKKFHQPPPEVELKEECRRLSNRTSLQMFSFITENMIHEGEKVKGEEIPLPKDDEWDAVIQQVQKDEEILKELVEDVQDHLLELHERRLEEEQLKVAEVEEADCCVFPVKMWVEPIENERRSLSETPQAVATEMILKTNNKQKKTVKKRIVGFIRKVNWKRAVH